MKVVQLHRKHMLFCYNSRPKTYFEPKPLSYKGQFLPLFNINLSQPQVNSTSTQFQLNFDSTSCQPHFHSASNQPQPQYQSQLNLNLIWL